MEYAAVNVSIIPTKRIKRGVLTLPVRKIQKVNVPPTRAKKSPVIKASVVPPPPLMRKSSRNAVIPAETRLVRKDFCKRCLVWVSECSLLSDESILATSLDMVGVAG